MSEKEDPQKPVLVLAGFLSEFKYFVRRNSRSRAEEERYRFVRNPNDCRGYDRPQYVVLEGFWMQTDAPEILDTIMALGGRRLGEDDMEAKK